MRTLSAQSSLALFLHFSVPSAVNLFQSHSRERLPISAQQTLGLVFPYLAKLIDPRSFQNPGVCRAAVFVLDSVQHFGASKEVAMSVKLILRGKEYEVKPGMTVGHALEKIGVNPETVLATRAGELITEDEIVKDGDVIKLVAVISGG
jgi:sulfur carrier protein